MAAIFLAAVHDIGKATSYFQSVITRSYGEKYEEITGRRFVVNKVYRAEGRTPHSYAGLIKSFQSLHHSCIPRMCGGDPATFKKKEVREEYSSHVWR